MVIDTSAVIAILTGEAEREEFLRAITMATDPVMSAITLYEACIVLDGKNEQNVFQRLEAFIRDLDIRVIPFSGRSAERAYEAYAKWGKGNHKASLNLCDCPSYALARELDVPLLFKGGDFTQTDVTSAMRP